MSKTIQSCTACGDKALTTVGKYRPLGGGGLSADAKRFLIRNQPLLSLIPVSKLKRFRDFPFLGNIVRCSKCGLSQMSDMPTDSELSSYYSSAYWSFRSPRIDLEKYKTCDRGGSQIEFISGHRDPSKISSILEIGAGSATPSLRLRDANSDSENFTIDVVEPGEFWGEYYNKLNITVVSEFFPAPIKRKYSHIHASHWLEHSTDPGKVSKMLFEITEPGGTVFIEVPFSEEEYWNLPLNDAPHTLFFGVESLKSLFEMSGYETLECGRFGIDLADFSRGGWPSGEQYYAKNADGFWLRALFRRPA